MTTGTGLSGFPELSGTHPVPKGLPAKIGLSAYRFDRTAPPQWVLTGSVPPAGRRATGC